METISQVLFWVANSLLIPDILLLLLLFIRALLLVGGIYNQYMAKRKNDKRLNDLIKNLTPDKVDDLRLCCLLVKIRVQLQLGKVLIGHRTELRKGAVG